jgi:predicted DNA-binding transcriptional regulator AlpA
VSNASTIYANPEDDRILRCKDAAAFVGLGKTQFYATPELQRVRVQLSQRAVGWRLGDLRRFVQIRQHGPERRAAA